MRRATRLRMSEVVQERDAFSCLRCGHVFDRTTGVGSAPKPAPKIGDLSLCIRCGDPAFFIDGPPWLRAPTPAELAALDADPEIATIRSTLAAAIAARPS